MAADSPPPAEGMVQCQVTGKWVPADELITFQGYTVCAEGKEELVQRLKSGERLPGEMERPGFWRRFGCLFLDGIVMGIVAMVLNVAIMGTLLITDPSRLEALKGKQAVASLIGMVIGLAYFTLLHGTRGQTLGKMAGKIKVVRLDGSAIGVPTAFVRALFYMGPQAVVPFMMFAFVAGSATLGIVQLVSGLYVLANCLVLLSDRAQQRAIHDRAAGTRVIMID